MTAGEVEMTAGAGRGGSTRCFRQGEGRDASPAVISKRSEKSCLSDEI